MKTRLTLLLVLATTVLAGCGDDDPAAAPTTTAATTSTSAAPATTTTTAPAPSTTTSAPAPTTTTTTVAATTTTVAPTTTTEAGVDAARIHQLVLDGLEQFGVLGDPAEPMIDLVVEAFGLPDSDSDWTADDECATQDRGMRTLVWADPGIRLKFADGDTAFGTGRHFAGYSTRGGPWVLIDAAIGDQPSSSTFPDAEIVGGPGLDIVNFAPDSATRAFINDARIVDFWAGLEFCGGD